MEKFGELIMYMKEIRENTSEGEPSCPIVNLKNGELDVFKLSNTLTANIYLTEKRYTFQIEDRRNGRVAVYPPDGFQRSTIATYYDYEDSLSKLLTLKAERKWTEMLIENLRSL